MTRPVKVSGYARIRRTGNTVRVTAVRSYRRRKPSRQEEETVSEQPLTIARLQQEVAAWTAHNFPGKRPYQPLLGALEELGELAHAHIKAEQGIRGTSAEHQAAKVDAVGDIVVFLADYCQQNDIDMQAAVEQTWAQVRQRDWRAHPQKGQP